MNKTELAKAIFTVRYPRRENKYLEEYLEEYGSSKESITYLLNKLSELLQEPLPWEGYALTRQLEANTEFFNQQVKIKIQSFSQQPEYSAQQVRDFFLQNHEIIKYAIGRWLLANAGIALERFYLTEENVAANFLSQLQKKDLKLGDEVIHLHVVSNNERLRLQNSGFSVPYEHWDREYYVDALKVVASLLESNPTSLGLFCEYSWIFDPKLHELASDGKPYVSFNFLADGLLVGERYFVGEAKPDNEYYKQYEFALRNPRRLELHQKGEFIPMAYGIYYPKDKLLENLKYLSAE